MATAKTPGRRSSSATSNRSSSPPDGCDVESGTLSDLHTRQTIEFRRGEDTSDDVQIDQVIPLRYASDAGAWQWSPEQREAFANDPGELRAVDGLTNNAKGDRGPSRRLPPAEPAHVQAHS